MNQVITHHGWGLDSNMWVYVKKEFLENNWTWQDNERGYYSKKTRSPEWLESGSDENIEMAICHSLGTHLIKPSILFKASHVVLLNSFYNFIPQNKERYLTTRVLKRMEKKFETFELNEMIKEFIHRSFLPNPVESNFQKSLEKNLDHLNSALLLNDFQELYKENRSIKLFSKDCHVLIIKSKEDSILRDTSCNEFINLLNNTQIKKPKVIEIDNQGHLMINLNIFKLIKKWINKSL